MMEYVPGQRLEIRGEEWLLRRVDAVRRGVRLDVVGISPLVRDREAFFLSDIEEAAKSLRIIDPHETRPVPDTSPYYLNARLHLETLIRATAPDDGGIHLGHKAAMDVLPYQFAPALQALSRPRARILIADAVGLGKTLECGILLTELMKRGRGRRLLVVTVKSMLEQFQREMWGRFSIPVTRLDSDAIRRIRAHIPSNQNPFHYYDKTIVSVDTLKTQEYQTYLRSARWDVIVIDEAHNVASRDTHSQRYALARELSTRCDSLILMSATPHDGKQESFSSIVDLLEPTAIVRGRDYEAKDIADLYIRRRKQDIPQVAFQARVTTPRAFAPTPEERAVYEAIENLHLKMDEDGVPAGGRHLFRTLVAKTYASSPAACVSLLENRLDKLRTGSPGHADIAPLERLQTLVGQVTAPKFSKYKELVDGLRPGGWLGWQQASDDRIVIFTESIPTLDFLLEHLPKDLRLRYDAKDKKRTNQVARMDGAMKDTDQMEVVKSFADPQSPLRVLLVSDVASEGINLHPRAHRLIHFDIPWSLLTLQQRNGRIDRYGQTRKPEIHYLLCENEQYSTLGDAHVLKILIGKDEEVSRTIGDPREFTLPAEAGDDVPDERIIGNIIEQHGKAAAAELAAKLTVKKENWLTRCLKPKAAPAAPAVEPCRDCSLFADDGEYGKALFEFARARRGGAGRDAYKVKEQGGALVLDGLPADFYQARLRRQFPGAYGEDAQWVLCPDRAAVGKALAAGNAAEWPAVQLLWEQHPLVQYLASKVTADFARNTAPVIETPALGVEERIVLGLATVANKRGVLVLQKWFGVLFHGDQAQKELLDLQKVIDWCRLRDWRNLPNAGPRQEDAVFPVIIRKAVDVIGFAVQDALNARKAALRQEMDRWNAKLEHFRNNSFEQLEFELGQDKRVAGVAQRAFEAKRDLVRRQYDQTLQYVQDSLSCGERPGIRITTLFTSSHH